MSWIGHSHAHRDRHQCHTRLAQFATIKCTTPLKHLVRVRTMGLRHLGYPRARLQRQLHNLKLLRNRSETAKTTIRTQPYCVKHEPIFGSPISLSLVGTRGKRPYAYVLSPVLIVDRLELDLGHRSIRSWPIDPGHRFGQGSGLWVFGHMVFGTPGFPALNWHTAR